uniref:Retinoid-binding protein 7-like n=1 Tax=Sinocyclocheilus grahami TaxID=75366 RepID=A0A672K6G0_SINGR
MTFEECTTCKLEYVEHEGPPTQLTTHISAGNPSGCHTHTLHLVFYWNNLQKVNKMPVSLCGSWDMVSNVNFEGYMTALGNLYTRKIALKLKHRKVIEQVGERYVVKTLSTIRNYTFSFRVNEEFQEFTKGLDDRHCKSLVAWEGNKLVCIQKGEKKNRGWAHWIEDDKLHLDLHCEDQVCKQVFKRVV